MMARLKDEAHAYKASAEAARSKLTDGSDLRIEKAGILDIPLIFQLLLDGVIAGAFSDRYLFAAGHFKLFLWIVNAIAPWRIWPRRKPDAARLVVIYKGKQDVGFAQIHHGTSSSGAPLITLILLAIAKEHGKQNIGTWVIATIVGEMPEDAVFEVYCSKYARAMQHVLHKMRFKRDKIMHEKLTRFTFSKDMEE